MTASWLRRALLVAAAAAAALLVVPAPASATAAGLDAGAGAEDLVWDRPLVPTAAPPAQVAAAPAKLSARDRFGVSGGGVRAMTGGLVFFDVMKKRGVSYGRTTGLSGGGWAVLVEEAMDAGEALKKLNAYTVSHLLGAEFSGFSAGISSDPWAYFLLWEVYVEKSFKKPLGLVFKEDGDAEVLVGTTIVSPVGTDIMGSCITTLTGPRGKNSSFGRLECHTLKTHALLVEPKQMSLSPGWPAKDRVLVEFKRMTQATLTSTAYLFLQKRMSLDDVPFRLKTRMESNGRASEYFVEFWDLGIHCNLPIAPSALSSPGVSVIADLSDDGDTLFKTLDGDCRKYWKFEHEAVFVESKEPLVWNGQRLNVAKAVADPQVGKYVRRVDFRNALTNKPTGRSALVVTMGVLVDKKMLSPEERFKGIETIDGTNPKRIKREGFEKLNVHVRAFYERVWELLLSP